MKCSECENEYKHIGKHWSLSDTCSFPDVSRTDEEILAGLVMGDASLTQNKTNAVLEIGSTNREFLSEVSDRLSIPVKGPVEAKTGSESQDAYVKSTGSGENYDFSDTYRIWTPVHSQLTEMRHRWYPDGEKRYPDDIILTPVVAKYWYASDGGLQIRDDCRPRAQITCSNEKSRSAFLISLFEDAPVSPQFSSNRLYFSVNDTPEFLSWIGDPVKGYKYKWEL